MRIAFLFLLLTAWAAAAVGGLVEVPVPLAEDNPHYPRLSAPVPRPGQTVDDPRLGTRVARVTASHGIEGRHEYSRHDPFNADAKMIVLPPEGEWRVYHTDRNPYNQPGNLVAVLRDVAEPRWDPKDPGRIWVLKDFQLMALRLPSGKVESTKDFSKDPAIAPILRKEPDLYRVTTRDEGESSADMRWWAFILQGTKDDYRSRYAFCWDRATDRVEGVLRIDSADSDVDWVGMSALGGYVLIGGMDGNTGRLVGLTMADRALTRLHRLDYTTSHADVGVDAQGREVVVMQSSRTDYVDLIPVDWSTKPILEAGESYEGSGRTRLVRLFYADESPIGFTCGIHISASCPGWAVISTHASPGVPEKSWLDRTVLLVRLDPSRPRAWYLSKIHNTTAEYWEETQASLSRDGRRVVWAANWDEGAGTEQPFMLRLDLPPLESLIR